jgi:Fic-DOC domain mobile mystery protein B
MKLEYPPGATPIDPDEASGLIPSHLTRQGELNEFEEANILSAADWLFARRRGDPLDERFMRNVHRRMFGKTWKWAGHFRRSDKNIGVPWNELPVHLRQLVEDVGAQITHGAYAVDEIVARFHHRLVAIHAFPNGNGRHARMMADLLLMELEGRRFEWGRGSLVPVNELRALYITALQSADRGDYGPLLRFLGCDATGRFSKAKS